MLLDAARGVNEASRSPPVVLLVVILALLKALILEDPARGSDVLLVEVVVLLVLLAPYISLPRGVPTRDVVVFSTFTPLSMATVSLKNLHVGFTKGKPRQKCDVGLGG
jgi:hypothetical protein